MTKSLGDYEIDTDPTRLQFDRVHGWLTNSYWCPGIPLERVERAAKGTTMVVAVYKDEEQVAYMRVISDKTTFAWVCDVFVAEEHRKKGIAHAMVQFALDHPEFQGLRRWLLATKDAHDIYESCGFIPLPNPERWMSRPGN